MKCRYAHCKCGKEVEKNEAVKVGNAYYHHKCYEEKQNKRKILEIYKKYYNPTEGDMMINKAINQVVHSKGFAPEYVLFVLCQTIRNKRAMNNIMALHYLVNDKDYLDKYKKIKVSEKVMGFDFNGIETVSIEPITYNQNNNKTSWSSTLFK